MLGAIKDTKLYIKNDVNSLHSTQRRSSNEQTLLQMNVTKRKRSETKDSLVCHNEGDT